MKLTSILKPDQSVMAGAAVAGSVFAIYSTMVGSVAQAQVSDAHLPALESSRKKAAYTSFVFVSGLFLITRDGNIATLGWGSIIAAEIAYRHGIAVQPQTNRMMPPTDADFQNAGTPLTAVSNDDVAMAG